MFVVCNDDNDDDEFHGIFEGVTNCIEECDDDIVVTGGVN